MIDVLLFSLSVTPSDILSWSEILASYQDTGSAISVKGAAPGINAARGGTKWIVIENDLLPAKNKNGLPVLCGNTSAFDFHQVKYIQFLNRLLYIYMSNLLLTSLPVTITTNIFHHHTLRFNCMNTILSVLQLYNWFQHCKLLEPGV